MTAAADEFFMQQMRAAPGAHEKINSKRHTTRDRGRPWHLTVSMTSPRAAASATVPLIVSATASAIAPVIALAIASAPAASAPSDVPTTTAMKTATAAAASAVFPASASRTVRGKPGFKRFGGGSRFEGATRSGPRARAVETRRFADRTAFVQTASVRLDADVARFFKTPEDVNSALRQVIALSRLVRERQAEEAPEALPEEASAGTPGENEAGQASGAETAEDDAGAIEEQAGDEPGKPLAEHGA